MSPKQRRKKKKLIAELRAKRLSRPEHGHGPKHPKHPKQVAKEPEVVVLTAPVAVPVEAAAPPPPVEEVKEEEATETTEDVEATEEVKEEEATEEAKEEIVVENEEFALPKRRGRPKKTE